ncbi:MAG: hybrid sensor histidine kinase/response regulator [Desulfovibrionaceae bacterium]
MPKILIIEDSKSVQSELIRRIESELRFDAVGVGSLAQACEAMDQGGIFLAIADLSLPDSTDGTVVDAVLERGIPCLVFTSDMASETRSRILEKDVVDYVVKNRHGVDNLVAAVARLHRNKGRKVLVVDSSVSMTAYLSKLLALQLLDVRTVSSGEDALRVLAECPDIGLAVVDHELEDTDGVDLTVRIRSRSENTDLAIMGLSSRSNEPLSVRFIKNGANDFLKKPFEREEFLVRINQLVDTVERQRRLRELDELKNKLLGMAAHDLRNPINAITGFTKLLLQTLPEGLGDDQLKMLQYIQIAGWQMNALVSDLLDISAIESGRLDLERTHGDISALVQERVEVARLMAAEKDIVILVEAEKELGALFDRRRIGQVLDNLLSNAIKFADRGTKVTVQLEHEPGGVVLCVRDQGPGISPAERDKLFLSFQKLSNRPTAGEISTGLGLAIVKKIVEAHQGVVTVTSKPGQGSTFCVHLPVPFQNERA